MRNRPFAAMDATTLLLVVAGSVLLAASIVGFVVLAQPTRATPETAPQTMATIEATAAAEPDTVATVLRLDATASVGGAARTGDRVDVLGYFPRQVTGDENVTRVLVSDVPVLGMSPDGGGASLTLAVSQSTALLIHEAQALGARPFVVLRSARGPTTSPASLNDSQLAERLSQVSSGN